MNLLFVGGIGRRLLNALPPFRGFFFQSSLEETTPIPFATILLSAAAWALAVIPLHFGYPLSVISFAFGYVAIFLTAFATAETVRLISGFSLSTSIPHKTGFRPSPCPTCEIFSEFTNGFKEIPSNLEAVYIEHLSREHEVEP